MVRVGTALIDGRRRLRDPRHDARTIVESHLEQSVSPAADIAQLQLDVTPQVPLPTEVVLVAVGRLHVGGNITDPGAKARTDVGERESAQRIPQIRRAHEYTVARRR